jgi:hypothetical protein
VPLRLERLIDDEEDIAGVPDLKGSGTECLPYENICYIHAK